MNGYKPSNGSPNQNQRKPNGVGQNLHGKARHPVNPNQPVNQNNANRVSSNLNTQVRNPANSNQSINQNNANKQALREVRKDENFSKSQSNGLVNQFKSLEKKFNNIDNNKKRHIFLGVWIGFTSILAIGVSIGVGVSANKYVEENTWIKLEKIELSANFTSAIQGINSEDAMNQKIVEAKTNNELAKWIQDDNLGDVSKHIQSIDATYALVEEKNQISFQIVWADNIYVSNNADIKNVVFEFEWNI